MVLRYILYVKYVGILNMVFGSFLTLRGVEGAIWVQTAQRS